MRSLRFPPLPRRSGTLAVALTVALAATVASATLNPLAPVSHVVVGGPSPMHPAVGRSPDQERADDGPAPVAPQPAALAVPLGPHLDVPILYFHYIRTVPPSRQATLGYRLSIAPPLFARQMALLAVEGAHPINLSTLMAALTGQVVLPPHPVVLTFDDGYADFATAAVPVLSRYGFVATDFVVSGFIGRRSYMTAAQVRRVESLGMVIGAHTTHHVDLATVPLAMAQVEIDAGKAALERLLGHSVLDFAYPYGGFTPEVAQLVQQAGFVDGVTTMYGDAQSLAHRFLLYRTEIGGSPSLAGFAQDAGLPSPTPAQLSLITRTAARPPMVAQS